MVNHIGGRDLETLLTLFGDFQANQCPTKANLHLNCLLDYYKLLAQEEYMK